MNFRSVLIILFTLICEISVAQIFTDSNLPIVIINTDGGVIIPDNPRVLASMKIIKRGGDQRNWVTDQDSSKFLNYDGRINIEIRGSSSQYLRKKQYGLTTLESDNISNRNVSLLGLPVENDWILNALGFDPSLMRDYICYNLSRRIGNYATRTVYCEVIINGSYNGLYVLQEKIKAGDDRVDVKKISPSDKAFPKVTGGYITKADKTTGGDPVAWTMPSYLTSKNVLFIHELPKPENVTLEQNNYIKGEFEKLDYLALGINSSSTNGWPSVIDVSSFIDYMLLNEYSANTDAYQLSTFFHKDRNGKLRAGPIWDHNLTFGNDLTLWGFDRSKYDTWQFSNGDNTGARFWKGLFDDPVYRCYLSRRFNELIMPDMPLNRNLVYSLIDSTALLINEALSRENQRWGTVNNFTGELTKIKDFISNRINWMYSKLGSGSNCINAGIPELAITRIMYCPETSVEFPSPDDLEFIEVTNTGTSEAVLSGIFFAGTGFVYQFPMYSVLPPGVSVTIAGNAAVFKMKYGFFPFGQFTRDLSDTGEKLLLSDAYGNVIDYVCYSDAYPWPEARGNGKYLNLKDYKADNNLGSSWEAVENDLISAVDVNPESLIKIYPSPVTDKLVIEHPEIISEVHILNLQGQVLMSTVTGSDQVVIEMNGFTKGIYIIKLVSAHGNYFRKIIKM